MFFAFLYYLHRYETITDLEKSLLLLTSCFSHLVLQSVGQWMTLQRKYENFQKNDYTFFTNKEALVQSVVFSMYNYITTNLTQIREKSQQSDFRNLMKSKCLSVGSKLKRKHLLNIIEKILHLKTSATNSKKQFDFMTKSVGKSLIKGVIMKLFRPSIDIDFISRMYLSGWWASKM